MVVTFVEFQVEYRAYLGQIPACNGDINEFNLSCKSVTNNSCDMSRIGALERCPSGLRCTLGKRV